MTAFLNKLTSRKFLLALVGVVSGLAMALGLDGADLVDMIGKIAGVVSAAGSAIAYITAEAKVDAAAVQGGGRK